MNATHVMHASASPARKLIARIVGIVNAIREAHRKWYPADQEVVTRYHTRTCKSCWGAMVSAARREQMEAERK